MNPLCNNACSNPYITNPIMKFTINLLEVGSIAANALLLIFPQCSGEWRATQEAPHRKVGAGCPEGNSEPPRDAEGRQPEEEKRHH